MHPDLAALTFLLGTWRGSGRGEYPTIDPFPYDEEVVVEHVEEPFLLYRQSSWSPDDGEPLHLERGFLRPGSAPGSSSSYRSVTGRNGSSAPHASRPESIASIISSAIFLASARLPEAKSALASNFGHKGGH